MGNILPVSLAAFESDAETSPNGWSKVKGKSCCSYSINMSTKVAKLWLIGQIGNIEGYTEGIALIKALSSEYILHVYINSPGGAISTAAHIISAMDICEAHIVTHNIGLAASCGSLILCCGNMIEADQNTTTMFHSSGFGSQGLSHRIRTAADHLIGYVNMLFDMMRKRGLVTEEEFINITTKGAEYYHSSDEINRRLEQNNIRYRGAL